MIILEPLILLLIFLELQILLVIVLELWILLVIILELLILLVIVLELLTLLLHLQLMMGLRLFTAQIWGRLLDQTSTLDRSDRGLNIKVVERLRIIHRYLQRLPRAELMVILSIKLLRLKVWWTLVKVLNFLLIELM